MSAGWNQLSVLGRLVDHPEELRTKSGRLFIKAPIEVWTHRKGADGANETEKRLVIATMFAAAAELFLKHVRVGDVVHLSGKLEALPWEGSNGKKGFSLNFVVEHISLLPNARKGTDDRSY